MRRCCLRLQDVLAQNFQESSKKAVKRAKFTPSEQKTNEERQLETAAEEKRQKKKQAAAVAATKPLTADKNPSATSLDGLKERLALKIQAHREQRKADEKTGKKRKENAGAKIEPAPKKRKTGAAFNSKPGKKDADSSNSTATANEQSGAKQQNAAAADVSAESISYGSLLLADEKKPVEKKTRNGQGIRGIKNLLKKAEKNQQRMAELKKTEEGKAVVEAKQWDKAIKQAAGETVMDDPKLLRNKLKKKEKAKAKSSKDWCVRVVVACRGGCVD